MSSVQYRPEIDGLRAIAVLGVVLFHLELCFSGGYVGVDVFFVISGYLITLKMMDDLGHGTFSLTGFWMRRLRRIFPAVTAMAFGCLAIGYVILTPREYMELARSVIAQTALVANIYSWQNSHQGYFSADAGLIPLLHMWSLAVEEQFYILFPIVVSIFFKYCRRFLAGGLSAVIVFSLGLSCWAAIFTPSANFYLLPTRAWELAVGGALAVHFQKNLAPKLVNEVVAFVGFLLILLAMFGYDADTTFPGWMAIPPVAGTSMVILANTSQSTFTGRLLSARLLVFIGLISYSLYLWHWPLLAFARHCVLDVNLPWKIGILSVSFIMALLSWRWVEVPFRRNFFSSGYQRALSWVACLVMVLVGLSHTVWLNGGIPNRFDHETRLRQSDLISDEFKNLPSNDLTAIHLGVGDSTDSPDFVIWGDSHAFALLKVFDDCATGREMRGLAFVRGSSIPVTGLVTCQEPGLVDYNEKIMEQVLESGTKNVILVSRWTSYLEGRSEAELAVKEYAFPTGLLEAQDSVEQISREHSTRLLSTHLEGMGRKLKNQGINLWLITQAPETNSIKTARDFYIAKRYPSINALPSSFTVSLKDHLQRESNVNRAFSNVPSGLLDVENSTVEFFSHTNRLQVYGERAYFRDDNHLTQAGAEHYYKRLIDDLLSKLPHR